MRFGVKQKLVVLSLLILVVMTFTLEAVQTSLSGTWIEEDLKDRAIVFAREIAATIGDRHELVDAGLLAQKVRQILAVRRSVLQLDIVRFGAGGEPEVVATSDPARLLPFTAADAAAVRHGEAVVSRLLSDATGRSWEVMAPITLDDAVAGAVAAKFSLNRFDSRAAQSRARALQLTAASVLVMGGLMALAVHLVVTRPVKSFVRAMKSTETVPVEIDRSDEFGDLAREFNAMMARVRETLFAMQRDLSHAERLALSGRMMAEVAHELGTPLHSVMGHLELLREDLPAGVLTASASRRLLVMESQLRRLTEIIAQLLDLTQRNPEPPAEIDARRLVRDTVELVQPAVAAAGLTLTVADAAAVPALSGRRGQLQQVVLNLLTNALDATPPGGAIHVSTSAAPGGAEVVLEVRDTGSGIPAHEQKRIFDPFFTTKAPGSGTGLGLFISAQIVADHGGHIEVSSEEGAGSAFRVMLPVGGVRC
jgi:signal transduction histidine kinase